MPYTRPQIDDEAHGLPRQPIPLRLVPFITGWSVKELLKYLSELQEERYTLLTAYEYSDTNPSSEEDKAFFENLLLKITGNEPLKILPSNYFIWSDKLAEAYYWHLEQCYPREHDIPFGFKLIWNPALGESRKLIDGCSDFYKALPKSLQHTNKMQQRTAKLKERNQHWFNKYLEKKQKNPNLSDSELAKKIAELPIADGKDAETIRKALRPLIKKLGK